MGEYSYLRIGDIEFAWKYQVPTFLTFVFKEEDLFIKRETVVLEPGEEERTDIDPDELYLEEAGFRTTAGAARAVLDEYGYTVDFFADIYDSFLPGLNEAARVALDDEIGTAAQAAGQKISDEELKSRVSSHLASSPDTPITDLRAFTAFLRDAIETDLQMEPFLEDIVLGDGPNGEPKRISLKEQLRRFRASDLADFEELQMLVLNRASQVPANVLRPLLLFDEGYVFTFPEILSLLYTRLMLDAVPSGTRVELDVHQIVETEAEVRSLHSDLALELLHKVDVYERVFRALSAREADVQDRYARTQVRNGLSNLERAGGPQAKGEALEALMAAAFSIKPHLQVVERTYSTGDEEIDLVVKNNVDRPFWQSLGSPLMFVECKNWTAPVGAPEVRSFEIKVQNHTPLTRIGILIAPGGFTSEVANAIKRSSREPYSIVLANRADLEHLAYGAESILDWLEAILSKPI